MKKSGDKIVYSSFRYYSFHHISILISAAWGFFEVGILRFIGFIESFWPGFYTRFMNFLHGHFGGTIIPFQQSIFKNMAPITDYKRCMEHGDTLILPTQEILNLILHSNMKAEINQCFCRNQQLRKGEKCQINAPLETCLTLKFPQSLEKIDSSTLNLNLAPYTNILYKFFQKCEKIGLVHQIIWMPEPNYSYVICNCCPCCCEVLSPYLNQRRQKYLLKKVIKIYQKRLQIINNKDNKRLKKKIRRYEIDLHRPISPVVARSAFIATSVSENECIKCGKCISRCYFGAREWKNGNISFNPSKCYGCGLCVSTCPQNHIILDKRVSVVFPQYAHIKGKIFHHHPHNH